MRSKLLSQSCSPSRKRMRNSMADNRVVIKINYDKNKQRKELIDPKMVTVWHMQRIYSVCAILVVITLLGLWFFSDNNDSQVENSIPAKNSNPEIAAHVSQLTATEPVSVKSDAPQAESDARKVPLVKRPAAIIYDKQVIRAALTTAPKKNEPGDTVNLPVTIEQNQTFELFYFSQIKNPKSSTLFHRWYKNGQLMNKKQFEVKKDRATLISSKKFTAKDAGEWQVVLTDKNGKLLSEINYSVNQ